MLSLISILLAVLVVHFGRAEQIKSSFKVKEHHIPPAEWREVGLPHHEQHLNLRIALKQGKIADLHRQIDRAADPYHHHYGQHLTPGQVHDLIKPAEATIRLVSQWLDSFAINYTNSPSQDWVTARLPVRTIQIMLNTTYHEYENAGSKRTLIRTTRWSLPEYLHDHIDTIQPTTSFFYQSPQARRAESQSPQWFQQGRLPTYREMVDEDLMDRGHIDIPEEEDFPEIPTVKQACNRLAVSPFCIRTLYGTIGYEYQNSHKNGIGIVNFNGQSNNRSDLDRFLNSYRKDAAAADIAKTFRTEIVNFGRDQQTQLDAQQLGKFMDFEGALDIQTVIGVGFPIPVTAYNVGGRPQYDNSEDNEPYLEWLHYVMAQEALPPVMTISYADEEQTVPEAYARRVCNELAQLGARGISVIFASGDHGVGQENHCREKDDTTKFRPMFPASCPYVTAVGATRLVGPEVVAFDARGGFVSGGGFSNYFSRPDYQEQHVEEYIRGLDSTLKSYFNAEGRGYPDVSAIGYHYVVMWNGVAHLQDGTSASAPTFAAIVALVNDALFAVGRSSLGFLNPLLYSRGAEAFKDVVHGSNFGCNTTGFPSVKGWDPASGLGTPWFPTLREIALRESFREERPWYIGYR